jgi:hypothetical protein
MLSFDEVNVIIGSCNGMLYFASVFMINEYENFSLINTVDFSFYVRYRDLFVTDRL